MSAYFGYWIQSDRSRGETCFLVKTSRGARDFIALFKKASHAFLFALILNEREDQWRKSQDAWEEKYGKQRSWS